MDGAGAAPAPFAPMPSAGSSASWNAQKNNVLRIVGLMGMASFTEDRDQVRREFALLAGLFRNAQEALGEEQIRVLSMGMSGDYEVAIEEGATHVRVGSAIFGSRRYRVDGELGAPQTGA